MKALTTFLGLAALFLLSLTQGHGHGSMADPISRVYEVFLENPERPTTDAGRAAVAAAGTQAFYDWHEVNRQLPNHDYRTKIPDGKLPGAGRDKYAGLNLVCTDWPATRMQAGPYRCVFAAATPHDPSYFEAYITKAGYDPRQPLKWSDLEPLPGGENARLVGRNYLFDVTFPQRTGRHILYVIWQRIDPVGEVFFSTSDLDFGGVDYGTASPTPRTAPAIPGDPYGTPTPTPTPGATPAPTPSATPTPTPGGTPVPGSGNTRYENAPAIATFKVVNDWISGYQAEVTIENKTSALLRDWCLAFRYAHEPVSPWNARLVAKSGDRYLFDAQPYLWNKDIPAKGKVSFGYSGAPGRISTAPTEFLFQYGMVCTTPGTPTPTPVPTPTPTPTPVPTPTPTPTPVPTPTPTPTPVPTPTPGSPDVTVDLGNVRVIFKVTSDWGSGFQGDVTIENKTSSVLKDWVLGFKMDRTVASIWNARMVSNSGGLHTFDAKPHTWNKDVPANGAVKFGFIGAAGNYKTAPTNFTFSPQGGSTPTPTPAPTPNPTPTPAPTPNPTPTPTPTPAARQFAIEDASVEEPASGTATVQVAVTLSSASPSVTGVAYTTRNGTATAGSDYQSASGTLVFQPGVTRLTIPVTILGDTSAEGLEAFTVELTSATGAALGRSVATVSIREKASGTGKFNYAEALQKSLFFYEAQRSGKLPVGNRVTWRGDSALQDGGDVGLDLSGGYYDAGDHVKFVLPGASTLTLLAWGGIEYADGYQAAGQKSHLLAAVRWGTDWLIKAHPSANVFYGQVGNGVEDHKYWAPPETMTMWRPSYRLDAGKPGTEPAGEAAASLAAAAILFRSEDPAYSAKLLTHARQLFTFADTYRGTYTASIPDAREFYNSYSGYYDELVWAAAWLYRATGESAYLTKAESLYNQHFAGASQKWTHSWDGKINGATVLLAQLTGKSVYKTATQNWLDFWTVGYNGSKIAYTSGGLAWLDRWGSLRYAANTSLLAFIYADKVGDTGTRYRDFARRQINYMLGENPNQRSYVVGFGNNPPINPHHRAAHGSWSNDQYNPVNNRHVLYGALVGGPASANDNDYEDDRANYVTNEVAMDYNAGFTGAVARMYSEFGGTPLANFPVAETPDDEFFVEASINQQGATFTEIRALLNNRSSFPARASDKLSFRYYLDLSELFATGYTQSAVTLRTNYSQGGTVSALKVHDAARRIYYVDVDFAGTSISPGSHSTFRKEIQFRFTVPNGAPWNPANDHSYAGLKSGNSNTVKTGRMPVYENGVRLSGVQP